MDSTKGKEIDERLSKIESMLTALQRSVDGLISEKRSAAPPSAEPRQRASAHPEPARSAPRPQPNLTDDIGATISDWFASRTPEWWLSRLGIGFVVIAVLFLYNYGIDRGW